MGLQIRVQHALGQRVIELPDRTVDEPLVVGRAATAEVQVPSVTVAPKHCVLFIHEGHWAVQDLGAGSGTFVNHEPVNGARFLQIGDVISIGGDSNAPIIEIDPAAAAEGRAGFAGTGLPQAPAAPYGTFAMPAAATAPMSQPAYGYAAPAPVARAMPPQPQYAAPVPAAAMAEAPAEEFPVYTPSMTYSSARRRKKSSNGPILLVIAGTLAMAGGVIAFAVWNNRHNEQVLAENEAVKKKAAADKAAAEKALQEAESKAKSKDVFVENDPIRMPRNPKAVKPSTPSTPPAPMAIAKATNPPSTPPSTPSTPPVTPLATPTATPPSSPKTPGADEGMDPIKKPATPASSGPAEEGMDPIKKPAKPAGGEEGMDPIKKPVATATPPAAPKKDPETLDPQAAASWDAMKELNDQGGKESFAVLRFEDYKRMSPGAHDAEIDQFIDKKMDRIWWERIAQLLKKIDKLNTDMTKIREELLDENNPDEKKKKLDAYKKMESDKTTSVKTLRDQMKYSGNDVPNLSDESSLTQLAGQRDKGAYELWKKSTIGYIKANQGRLAWGND